MPHAPQPARPRPHAVLAQRQQGQASGTPRNLGLEYAAGQVDGQSRGLNHPGQAGLVGRVIGGHWGLVPALQKLALAERFTSTRHRTPCSSTSSTWRSRTTWAVVAAGLGQPWRHCARSPRSFASRHVRASGPVIELTFDGADQALPTQLRNRCAAPSRQRVSMSIMHGPTLARRH